MYLATSIKVEWEYVSYMMISCIFCYRRYCMMWRHLAPPPLWVSWDIVRLLKIEKTRKHDTTINIEMMLLLTMLWTLFIHIHWNYTDNHIYFISMPFMWCSRLVIGEGSHDSNPQSCSVRPRVTDIRGTLEMRFVLYSMFVQLYLQKYLIFVLFLDKIS